MARKLNDIVLLCRRPQQRQHRNVCIQNYNAPGAPKRMKHANSMAIYKSLDYKSAATLVIKRHTDFVSWKGCITRSLAQLELRLQNFAL
jgi:hypothetical protein